MPPVGPAEPTTKTCPFCKEQVHAEAIKCRWCQSMLLPAQLAANAAKTHAPDDTGKTTYVLDQGLVSFTKFAAALLGIFLIIGASFYGFDLKQSLKETREALAEANSIKDSLVKTKGEITSARTRLDSSIDSARNALIANQQTVAKLIAEVEELEKTFEDTLKQKQNRVNAFFAFQRLSFTQRSQLAVVQVQQPELFRRGTSFWPTGTNLRIKFLDGLPAQRTKVQEIISRWFPHANLKFQFVTEGEAEVRISFAGKRDGYWSYLGTDARAVPQNKPTINFGEGWQLNETIVLREFGHALGLVTEFQNPNANIPWNKEAVYAEFASPPNLWSRETIHAQFFAKASVEKVGTYRPFDPNSVMMYELAASLTDGKVVPKIHGLSPSDKALIARIYPHQK